MKSIVSKFGGSSTANARNLERICRIIRASPARRWVVLSAPGIDEGHPVKVTAMLERCWSQRKHRRTFEKALTAVTDRLLEISDALGIDGMAPLIRDAVESAASASLPHMLSRGEHLCALIFSRYSGFPMVDAARLIHFDAEGRLDEAATYRRLQQLDCDGPVIVPGFYGADARGRIHILPRNGSDISGALVAAGVEAGLYENWTDVPGLMTADPVVVPQARLVPHVGYRQMRALSRAGARVLHPACLDPVAMAGIPTRLRCTWQPESFGTLIDERQERFVPCLAGRKDAFLPDGRPACTITVFAMPNDRVLEAAGPMAPLDTVAGKDQTLIYLAREQFEEALQHLHRELIGACG